MIEVKAISTQMRTLSVHMQSNYLDLCFILPYYILHTASCFQWGASPASRLLVEQTPLIEIPQGWREKPWQYWSQGKNWLWFPYFFLWSPYSWTTKVIRQKTTNKNKSIHKLQQMLKACVWLWTLLFGLPAEVVTRQIPAHGWKKWGDTL